MESGISFADSGRSRTWPTLAMTAYRFPRNRSSVRAFAGDSTITSGLAIRTSGSVSQRLGGGNPSLRYHLPRRTPEPSARLPDPQPGQFQLGQLPRQRTHVQAGQRLKVIHIRAVIGVKGGENPIPGTVAGS